MNTDVLARPRLVSRAPLRLVCFPPAGGTAAEYRGWRAWLGDAVDIVPVDLPGRGVRLRDDPTRSLAGLAADAAEQLVPVLAGRHMFYGHSMGGLVAHAVAALRQRHGLRTPDRLLIGACPPPHAVGDLGAVADLPDDRLATLMFAIGTPRLLADHPHWLRTALALLRDDLRLCGTGRPPAADPLPCPIDVFAGDCDLLVDVRHAAEWARYTTAACAVHLVEGGHLFTRDNAATQFFDLLVALVTTRTPGPVHTGSSAGQ